VDLKDRSFTGSTDEKKIQARVNSAGILQEVSMSKPFDVWI
jgi:hypothetical protein